jgi:hypothetical protein
MLNGIKVFNSEHQSGDVVEATRRSDGMWILDGQKAADVPVVDAGIRKFGEQPIGYLNGQVFNAEEDDLLRLSVDTAPDSPASAPEDGGMFTVRVWLNRPTTRQFRFRLSLSGSATYLVDYTISVDIDEDIIIAAGEAYKDIELIAILDEDTGPDETIIVTIERVSPCRIVKPAVELVIESEVSEVFDCAAEFAAFMALDHRPHLFVLNPRPDAVPVTWVCPHDPSQTFIFYNVLIV